MKRKKAGERVTHFRSIDDPGLAEFRRRALRWADDNGEKLRGAEPDMPPGFDNRLGDNWPCCWPSPTSPAVSGRRRHARRRLSCRRWRTPPPSGPVSRRHQGDLRPQGREDDAAPRHHSTRISSAELVAQLAANAESPWAEWKGGKPITQVQLARVLKALRNFPRKIRLESGWTRPEANAGAVRRCLGTLPSVGIGLSKCNSAYKRDGC